MISKTKPHPKNPQDLDKKKRLDFAEREEKKGGQNPE